MWTVGRSPNVDDGIFGPHNVGKPDPHSLIISFTLKKQIAEHTHLLSTAAQLQQTERKSEKMREVYGQVEGARMKDEAEDAPRDGERKLLSLLVCFASIPSLFTGNVCAWTMSSWAQQVMSHSSSAERESESEFEAVKKRDRERVKEKRKQMHLII